MPADPPHPYVSRGGLKLAHALDAFTLDVRGLVCADFGCSTGGFTDVLLRHGAERVVAVDTAYGVLDYRLRTDPRVLVMERTSALHAEPPREVAGRVDLVVIDAGWTMQRLVLPAAVRWLSPGTASGRAKRVVTLVKPHYELDAGEKRSLLRRGVLDDADALRVAARVIERMPERGVEPVAVTKSPIAGSKGTARGNAEWVVLGRLPGARFALGAANEPRL
jgi:23S rRNA (cytidine1920-2'-O)/16S rRNA (cytidine1409-2'-O)-methyltransferase